MSGPSLLALKGRGLLNAVRHGRPLGYLLAVGFAVAVFYGEAWGARAALEFLSGFPIIGMAVAGRVLETGFVVLAAGVAFSAVTTAISTLYLSEDLNLLLTQPISVGRVFAIKVLETFFSAAVAPLLLTLPIVVGLGLWFTPPWWAYPLGVLGVALAYMLPVGVGAVLAVFLVRVAPAGRVREVATGLGVALSAALVLFVRAMRPEVLLRSAGDPQQFERMLAQFAGPSGSNLPPAWAARVVWDAAHGKFSPAIWPLAAVSALALLLAGALAAWAYQAGWVRALESSRVRLDRRPRGASWLERFSARFGPVGALVVKDGRLLWRDPTQWSQLLILAALAGVYIVSVRAFPVTDPLFANVIGFVQLGFQGFVIAGVGIRLAFPAVSMEADGYWLLRTGPFTTRQIVMAKYLGALPSTLILAVALGVASSLILGLAPAVGFLSVLLGVGNALAITAFGVGLGAAMPRFHADNPAEIAVSPGGLLYMLGSLAFAAVMVVAVARPAYLAIMLPSVYPGFTVFQEPSGWLAVALACALTLGGTIAPLALGARALDGVE